MIDNLVDFNDNFENQVKTFKNCLTENLHQRLIKNEIDLADYEKYLMIAYSVVDHMVENWVKTQNLYYKAKPKRVYYISMEYLIGRTLSNSLICLGLYDIAKEALSEMGYNLNELMEEEVDAGLGNGGLGRLAACFMDSMANLGIPAYGYGLHYEYGMFNQHIEDGKQVEKPDTWKSMPYPWEADRFTLKYPVHFGGNVAQILNKTVWENYSDVIATAKDIPIPGFKCKNVNVLRLWSAQATEEFNLDNFSEGDYIAACENKVETENITKVLYPNDNIFKGKVLRLEQEYLLVSASIHDIIRKFLGEHTEEELKEFHKYVAIQLNDTHPALAVAELMRLFLDKYGIDWDTAWNTVKKTFAYTNHTLLPEALEQWPVSWIENMLPRHMDIIYKINFYFLKEVSMKYPGDVDKMRRMSIINEDGEKKVRMASLAVVGSHKVNGVAALHSELVKDILFKDYYEFEPEKFVNVTNGITPRRWIMSANKSLTSLITDAIGDGWKYDFEKIAEIEKFADDASFCEKWAKVKECNKKSFEKYILNEAGLIVNPETLFDVQVKRIHEYKRQLLLTLFAIDRYLDIKSNPTKDFVPRTIMIGGKAAPGYWNAKQIIHFINKVGEMINEDPQVQDKLKFIFLPNYRVSLAEHIIPAVELSEQISTAGYEASGTGNMKMTLNGALTIGTLDGANVEIKDRVGDDNIFIFGLKAQEVIDKKACGYNPNEYIAKSSALKTILKLIDANFFCQENPGEFQFLLEEFTHNDNYMLMADFEDYVKTQKEVEKLYLNKKEWVKKSILNVARCSFFSSDRSIEDYNRLIWNVKPVVLEK